MRENPPDNDVPPFNRISKPDSKRDHSVGESISPLDDCPPER